MKTVEHDENDEQALFRLLTIFEKFWTNQGNLS